MPIYEYVSKYGATTLRHRPVEHRDDPVVVDGVVYERITVPQRVMIGTGARPETMSQKALKGYKRLEDTGQLTDKPGYLPAKVVREALLAPEID